MKKRILFCYYAAIAENEEELICFYESIINSLIHNGNDILIYNSKFFNANPWKGDNILLPFIDVNLIEAKIKNFNPDLIITFNNSCYQKISNVTSCPIIFWAADSVKFFSQKDKLTNDDRNFFFATVDTIAKEYKEFGIKENKITIIDNATAIVAENIEQNKNISFIGSSFYSSGIVNEICSKQPQYRKKILNLVSIFLKKNNYNINELLEKIDAPELLDIFKNENHIYELFNFRLPILLSLFDLGLELYGALWGPKNKSLPWISLVHNNEKIFKLKHNQDVYNSSKICLNINHPQAGIEGLSWRVYDIMASNGCLLSNYNIRLHKIFKTEGINLPMFNSPYEAREIAIKLLNNNNMRLDIVNAAQNYIKNNISWDNVIKIISEVTGVKLLNNKHVSGKLEFMYQKDYLSKLGEITNKLIITKHKITGERNPIKIRDFLYKIYYLNIATILKKLNLDTKVKNLINKYI